MSEGTPSQSDVSSMSTVLPSTGDIFIYIGRCAREVRYLTTGCRSREFFVCSTVIALLGKTGKHQRCALGWLRARVRWKILFISMGNP